MWWWRVVNVLSAAGRGPRRRRAPCPVGLFHCLHARPFAFQPPHRSPHRPSGQGPRGPLQPGDGCEPSVCGSRRERPGEPGSAERPGAHLVRTQGPQETQGRPAGGPQAARLLETQSVQPHGRRWGSACVCVCVRGAEGYEGESVHTPVFLPVKFHAQRSLVGPNPWGRKESDATVRPVWEELGGMNMGSIMASVCHSC